MTHAIRIHANGGPEVMRWEEIVPAPPAAGEARIRHSAIGINYSDVNVRRGGFYLAKPQDFPIILGNEAAGVVESVGAGVDGFKPGERVVYAGMQGEFFQNTGAYAEARNVPAERLIALPGFRPAGGGADGQGIHRFLIINASSRPSPATRF
jgi:NADPH2:quinone reductase